MSEQRASADTYLLRGYGMGSADNEYAISFETLAGKLFSYCDSHFDETANVRIVTVFADHDQTKGNAVLTLFKQFSSFPLDVPLSVGSVDFIDLSANKNFSGISIVICALPECGTDGQPLKDERVDTLQLINRIQTALFDEQRQLSGAVIFLSGMSTCYQCRESEGLPRSGLIPWQLMVRKPQGSMTSYRLAALHDFLDSLEKSQPVINNLDAFCRMES